MFLGNKTKELTKAGRFYHPDSRKTRRFQVPLVTRKCLSRTIRYLKCSQSSQNSSVNFYYSTSSFSPLSTKDDQHGKANGLVTLGKQTVYVISYFAFTASLTNYSCPQFTKIGLLPRSSSLLVTLSFLQRAVLRIDIWYTPGAKTGQPSSTTIKGNSVSLLTALWARRPKDGGSITGKGLSYSVLHRDQTGLGPK